MSINKVILIGNAGKDPEVRYLENNTPVCNFSLATNESYTNKSGERVTNTEWHNIVLWRGLAEVAQNHVKKGTQLYIEGKIRTRSYDKDGTKRYVTEIVADTMQLLGKRPDDGTTPAPQPETGKQSAEFDAGATTPTENGNDLPF
jgi:single-strand DNA-binding protein